MLWSRHSRGLSIVGPELTNANEARRVCDAPGPLMLRRAKRARATNPAIPAISALGNSASPRLRGQDFLMRIDTTSDGQ